MKSSLARDPQLLNSIKCEIHFGTKRLISQRNWMNYLILDVFYGQICRIIFKIHGYLPAKLYRIGSDDDTYQAYATAYHWIHPQTNKWIDLEDNFPYGAEYSKHILQSSSTPSSRVSSLPPALVFTSSHDILATPKDVEHWCHEVGIPVCNIVKLCDEKYRYQQYNHFTMLTHPSCEKDHFQLVKQFLNKYLPSPGHSLPPSD